MILPEGVWARAGEVADFLALNGPVAIEAPVLICVVNNIEVFGVKFTCRTAETQIESQIGFEELLATDAEALAGRIGKRL